MTDSAHIADAIAQIDECERVVNRLHKMCCEPDRSPRMLEILEGLAQVRILVGAMSEGIADSSASKELVVMSLESIGSQLGSLQVACCAPARMPLYAQTLVGLTEVQLHVSAADNGSAHSH